MEPLFQNVTKYNAKNYNQFIEFHKNKYNFSYNLYTLIMTILLLYCIIFNIKQHNFSLLAVFILLLVLFLIIRLYLPARRYINSQKNFATKQSVSFTFNFYKHYFTIGKETFYYFKLFKVFETEDYFYLYINEDFAALISKKGFKIGNATDFSNFIKKKCIFKYSKQK